LNFYTNKKTLFYELKSNAKLEWNKYVNHNFVNQLGQGSLELNKFKDYLKQDYIFLQKFMKILSLGAYKSKNIRDMNYCVEFIIGIKHEIKLHIHYCKKFKISKKELLLTREKPENKNYTNFVLNIGKNKGILELFVALSPCIIGYGEIGYNLSMIKNWQKSKYFSWIKMYSSSEYQKIAKRNIDYIDLLNKNHNNKISDLNKIFKKATRLEAEFWQMSMK
tara:strand:- start:5780 stop:6442 length:663 start_codon:yes stop_codon:yes gene_type:complete